MSNLWWLTRKNLLRFFSDRRGAMMTILLPVVLGTLMGALMSPKQGPKDIPLLVVQQDSADSVSRFVAAVDAHEMFTVERVHEDEARRRVGSGDTSLALILPAGVGALLQPSSLFNGSDGSATLLFDPSKEFEVAITKGLLTQVMMEQLGSALADPKRMQGMFSDLKKGLDGSPRSAALSAFLDSGAGFAEELNSGDSQNKGGGLRPPIHFETEALTAQGQAAGYSHYAHNYAGMLLMFLLFAATSSAQSLLKEKEEGVLLRVQVSTVRPWHLLVSSGLSTAVIALVSSMTVYAVGIGLFGIEVRGPVLGFTWVLVTQAVLVGGFSVMLSGLGRSEKQISGSSTLLVLPACLLGGAMLPSFLFPPWLQAMQPLIPTYWATHGLAAMTWRGSGWPEALMSGGALLGFGLVFALIGVRRFVWDHPS